MNYKIEICVTFIKNALIIYFLPLFLPVFKDSVQTVSLPGRKQKNNINVSFNNIVLQIVFCKNTIQMSLFRSLSSTSRKMSNALIRS